MKFATINLTSWNGKSTAATVYADSKAVLVKRLADVVASYAARKGVSTSSVDYSVSFA
jgi:hypothetical protein